MILIADSGATKTDWRLIDENGDIDQYKSSGINPYQQSEEDIRAELMESLRPRIDKPVHQIFFYGAGCASEINKNVIQRVLASAFPNAMVKVNHDLMGAARALCGHQPGIACILGTGSNSCLYDGRDIVTNVPSLGYVIGDEGSGAWLGKTLLADFLRGDLDDGLSNKLIKRFEVTRDEILEQIYQKPLPNRYLAKYSRFIFQNIKHPYFHQLVFNGFELFFEKNVQKYKNFKKLPVHFTGSVAFYYNSILRQAASDQGITLGNIVESPIAGLALYHQNSIL